MTEYTAIKPCAECGILPRYLTNSSGSRLWCGRPHSAEGCGRVTPRMSARHARVILVNYWNDRQVGVENALQDTYAWRAE